MPENFAAQFLQKPTSSRSLTDPVPEESIKEDLPTPQLMIDSLYQIMMKRFDAIEELLNKEECKCQKK